MVLAPTLPRATPVNVAPAYRSIKKPVSLLELSAQVTRTLVVDSPVTCTPDGAAGSGGGADEVGVTVGVAVGGAAGVVGVT